MGRQIERWNVAAIAAIVIGTAFAYLITVAVPIQLPVTMLTLFFGAAVAICAMILPGISGSFILLLLGLYAGVLEAVRNLDVALLGVFLLGCIGGLLSFARLLSWLLDYARNITLAFLTGLLLGSLNKVWPWKETLTWRQNSHGEMVPLIESNVGPLQYEHLTGDPSHWLLALALMALGVVLVMALERWGRRA